MVIVEAEVYIIQMGYVHNVTYSPTDMCHQLYDNRLYIQSIFEIFEVDSDKRPQHVILLAHSECCLTLRQTPITRNVIGIRYNNLKATLQLIQE